MPVEVAPSLQTPLIAKQPPARLTPFPLPVDVAVHMMPPVTESMAPGVVVPPKPVLPRESIMKTVEVPKVVEVETANMGMVVELEKPATERRAKGDVVPTPNEPVTVEVAVEVAVKVANSGVVEARNMKAWSAPAELIVKNPFCE